MAHDLSRSYEKTLLNISSSLYKSSFCKSSCYKYSIDIKKVAISVKCQLFSYFVLFLLKMFGSICDIFRVVLKCSDFPI